MATNWILETISAAVSETGTKTAYLADSKNFNITDSTGSAVMFKVLNDSSDYYSMQLFGHAGQSTKFYITGSQGEAAVDSWLWEVTDGGAMNWKLRTSGTGTSVEDDTYENRLSLVSDDASATTLSVIADEGQDAIIKLVSDESDDS